MRTLVSAVYHRDIQTVEYTADNGDRLLRTGGTLAWRLNNPGNLRPSRLYQGVIGSADTPNGAFAIFSSPEIGRAEKQALLRRRYNDLTLRDAIYTYAPPNENDSEQYLSFVMRRTGLSESTIVSEMTDAQLGGIMGAMEQMEGYNARVETRQERWVHVTSVSLSDGSRPIPDYPVRIQRGDTTQQVRTNAQGILPPLVTVTVGEEVTFLEDGNDDVEVGRVTLEERSRSIVFARLMDIFTGASEPHNPPADTTTPAPRAPVRYVVQPGDTLSAIAQRFETSVAELTGSNAGNIRSADRIHPGQVIWIHREAGEATANATDPPPASPEPRETSYTVARGDTLAAIASRHGTSVAALMAANRGSVTNPDLIRPGQTLTLPSASATAAQPRPAAEAPPTRPSGQTTPTRSRENQGHPLAIVPLNQRRAPWMEHAYAEATRWAGQTEDVIGQTINYHHELGTKWLPSLSGSSNAWCASFVNWCLREAGYAISKDHFRARSFATDANFSQIDAPIYGALGMRGTSHVGFVYAMASNGNPILLGGNQSDQINFRAFGKDTMRYYVPKTYLDFALRELEDPRLEITTSTALNEALNITVNVKSSGNER
ncbi:TIGR02594 family protein [Brevibacterium sediminis]|uniref:TIGR02594 family protein n=1 Tax=Brevibacterium sediminis TaxID=1857024 RepID=UPI003B3AE98A